MKNLAGNNVAIFLYRFVLRQNAISFVLNEAIAEDMYPDIEKQMQPIVHACSETLLRHKALCNGETIMDGNILTDNCFEVQLSPGLGVHFADKDKQNLFNDAHEIAKLLMEVMGRRSNEEQQGIYPGPQPVINKIERTGNSTPGFEALGQQQRLQDFTAMSDLESPNLGRMKPEDLPENVIAKRSYDHRGYCIAFEHKTYGHLGKILLISMENGQTLMETELSKENPHYLGKKEMALKEVIAAIEANF